MGGHLSKLFGPLLKSKEIKIFYTGLDYAGKTTALYKLKLGDLPTSTLIPFINLESSKFRNIEILSFDLGGRDKMRVLWRKYLQGTNAVIFMLDSADKERFAEIQSELFQLTKEDELNDVPFLIFANKQDLPYALSASEITEKLELKKVLKSHKWHVQICCAKEGDGIFEGLDWLQNIIGNEKGKDLSSQSDTIGL